jgi:predicted DNA-binding transcriptional regulator YafY
LADRALYASHWNAIPESETDTQFIREALRDEDRLSIAYTDAQGAESTRTILPLAMIYYIDAIVLAAWCELREDFRHFRLDRITMADRLNTPFKDRAVSLRQKWRETTNLT